MLNTKDLHFFSMFFVLSLIFRVDSVAASNENETSGQSNYSSVHIGTLLDLNSHMGSMIDLCLSMAVLDFYSVHSNYKTRLFLDTKNAEEELDVASAVSEFLKKEEVHAVLGPQWSKEATLVAELGAKAHVPVISFTAKNRAFSHSLSPYFVRTTPDDIHQAKVLRAICQGFKWQEVVILYEDTEYGNLFLTKLNKAFQEVDIRLVYMVSVSTSTKDVDITKELNNLMTKQTRVFLVHMNILLGHRLFFLARKAGMMSEGYAWLITDSLSNFLTSVDSTPLEGVLGIRPHVPQSTKLDNFKAKWRMKPESALMEINIYGLWAYDTFWALAMATEKAFPLNSDFLKTSQGENRSDSSGLRISNFGPTILTELLDTRFRGLAGEFQLFDGQLQPSAFEIFNVIGTGERRVGYWTPERGISRMLSPTGESTYSTSTNELRAILWPGDTLAPPQGWAIPSPTGKLKIGVPHKDAFTEFVNITKDNLTNEIKVSGFSIDIFLASLELLPFKLDYEFIPYEDVRRNHNGTYYDMLTKLHDKAYDFVVGDVTILANRSKIVDFTLPYTESGVVMVVKSQQSIDMWIFLKPLRWDLWLTIVLACIFMGTVFRLLEHEIGDTNGLFFWFPIAILAFPERNMVANTWSRFLLVVWLFVAYILMQSYTAKLSSIFTVDQLQFEMSDSYNIGYQWGSFVPKFLVEELKFNPSKLKNYTTLEEYHAAMSLGSKKGGIDVIFGELPYMKLLLHRYASQYRFAGPTYKTDGFGFAFPMGSPLVMHFSRAILNVTQSANMTMIEQKNFGAGYPSDQDPINQDNPNLTAYNFGGLFIILGSATILALFCSKTSVGKELTKMVSNWGHKVPKILLGKGPKPPPNEPSPGEEVKGSENNRIMSNEREEIPPDSDEATRADEVNVSPGTTEIQESDESRNADAPADVTTGVHQSN